MMKPTNRVAKKAGAIIVMTVTAAAMLGCQSEEEYKNEE